ncbi:GTP-binding protein [Rhizobacter sp. Root1221]|uniref:CobW family GTP-binding protein n=1 Tax=Rhizobacter sp. Root1221 TaxID=1736433 RepID=UPI0006F9A673|nr:GTP-binding protein [Rhizobacter sp. Root1221]KQV90488.1 ATP-binding protein [Rhizobacter sp. Root1221]
MTPVTVLTGFLGSGKTTLLNRLLQRPELSDTAVIINEFGAVGIDHLLVDHTDENLRVLTSGCLCCTVRGDLIETLGALAQRRERGEVRFSRVIVETTGLANPAPVLHTLMAHPGVTGTYRLDGVVTTVDAFNGMMTLDRHAEAVKQVGMADALLLTKTDLVEPSAVQALTDRLYRLNPGARLHPVRDGRIDPAEVLGIGWIDPLSRRTLQAVEHENGHEHDHGHHHDVNRHGERVRSHAFVFDAPLPRTAFLHWLDLMAALRGERLLRVKGLVQLAEEPDRPLVVHGVQHVFHPPRQLDAWPGGDRRTRLVFIVDGIDCAEIVRTFQKFAGTSENLAP